MSLTSNSVIGFYDYRLVALSVLIAIGASYAALDLAAPVATSRYSEHNLRLAESGNPSSGCYFVLIRTQLI